MIFHRKTFSICDVCLKTVPAETFQRGEKMLIKKTCPEHGEFIGDHVWDDPEIYKGLSEIKTGGRYSAQLTIALSYKCNLNCPVCYARSNEIPDAKRISRKQFENSVSRYRTIYLTGGEPTLRKDLFKMIKYLKKKKKKVFLFSNGIKLADPEFCRRLREAGLDHLILQFDTTKDKDNRYIRGKELAAQKKLALENLRQEKIPVSLYAVILKGRNLEEIPKILEMALKYGNIKTISFNPLWRLGRFAENDFIPSSAILKKINRSAGVKNKDWINSMRLICNLEKITLLFRKRGRVFGKCYMRLFFFPYQGACIPITKLYRPRYLWCLAKQIAATRSFPFRALGLAIFPTKRNIDFQLFESCNLHAVSAGDMAFRPACLHRILALEKNQNN